MNHASDLLGTAQPTERSLRLDPVQHLVRMLSSISVATNPGVTVFTVRPMPSSTSLPARARMKAVSFARALVSPNMPALEAA